MVHYARENLALVKVSHHFLNVIIIITTTISNIIIIRCSSETHTTQKYLGTSESVWFSFSATLEDWWLDFFPQISSLIGLCWQLGWQVGLLTGFSVLSVMELLYHLGLLASALFNRKTWFWRGFIAIKKIHWTTNSVMLLLLMMMMIMMELLSHLGLLASTSFTQQTGSSWYQTIDCTWKYKT